MKTRLFLAALCIFLLPLCFGQSNSTSPQFSAYASGYMIVTGRNGDELIPCECWQTGCGGGDCGGATLRINPDDNTATSSRSVPTNSGSEILFTLTAIILWLRLRA
jgi:hypothetical protein